MKISLAWLNSYLNCPIDANEASVRLEEQGFPIESRDPVLTSNGVADEMLDVEVTSNRGDCLSHIGVAREIASGTDRSLLVNEIKMLAGRDEKVKVEDITSVVVDEPTLCPLYTARVIRGVRVGPSPGWLVDRLEGIGLRSVSNVVDVTNFVLHEMGQPLHAFDLNKLNGQGIVIRRANDGETITVIDGTKHALRANMLVIADAKIPVAIAGVMGGQDSEVSEQTTDVLLESAVFDPLSVRRSSRALRLSSDSSYRFERGLDRSGVERASLRAAAMIVELAGGELVEGEISVGEKSVSGELVTLRLSRCEALLGISLSCETVCGILERLGIGVAVESVGCDGGVGGGGGGKKLICTIPSYRLDLKREVDLIEEVARMYGLNRIPVHDKLSIVTKPVRAEVLAGRQLVSTLVAYGYLETVTFSFVKRDHGKLFLPTGEDIEAVEISDERRKAEPMLRPSVLPSLLLCRKSNQDVGNSGVRLFETASVWYRGGGKIVERRELGMLMDANHPEAVREMRGVIEELLTRLGIDDVTMTATADGVGGGGGGGDVWGVGATIRRGDQVLGGFGVLSKPIQEQFDLQKPVVLARLDMSTLVGSYPRRVVVGELPKYPGIERDLSVIVDERVTWHQIESVVAKANPAMMTELSFLMTYRGKQIGGGRKSVSLRMLFRDPHKTLRHDEVDPQMAVVIESLKTELGAELRC